MANVAKRRHVLPSAAWVDGGNIQIPLKDLPPKARVEAFVFRLEGVFTTGAAQAAIAGNQLHRMIAMLDIGPGIRGSGSYLHFMQWIMRGAEAGLAASIPNTNASTFRRTITWVVPFADKRAWAPLDALPVGADFNEKVISIDTASYLGLDGGTATWNTLSAAPTGTLRVEAILAPPNDAPGSIVQFGFADLTGQSPVIVGPGVYEDLFLYRENMGAVDSGQVATVAVNADGATYFDQIRHSELAYLFNERYSLGSDKQTLSATAPVGGEALSDTPDVVAGASAVVSNPFLPIVFNAPGQKKSQALVVENALRLDFTGSDTSYRVGFRRIAPHSEASAVQAFHRLGHGDVVSTAQIASKTESKKNLSGAKGHLSRFLPLRKR
jgi:hypothetical protein